MRYSFFTACCLVAIGLSACGGGGANNNQETLSLLATASEDVSDPVLFSVFFFDDFLRVGDIDANVRQYAFYTFDISGIPAGATITGAELRIAQVDVEGTPYDDLGGELVVDHVDVDGSIDLADLDGGTLAADVGTLSTSAAPGILTLAVADQVEADRAAGRTTSEYRLRFVIDTDSDNVGDAAVLEDAAGSGGTVPILMVTLTP